MQQLRMCMQQLVNEAKLSSHRHTRQIGTHQLVKKARGGKCIFGNTCTEHVVKGTRKASLPYFLPFPCSSSPLRAISWIFRMVRYKFQSRETRDELLQ